MQTRLKIGLLTGFVIFGDGACSTPEKQEAPRLEAAKPETETPGVDQDRMTYGAKVCFGTNPINGKLVVAFVGQKMDCPKIRGVESLAFQMGEPSWQVEQKISDACKKAGKAPSCFDTVVEKVRKSPVDIKTR